MALSNLPTVGGDDNTWGTEVNALFVELDDNTTALAGRVSALEALPPGTGAVASVNGQTGVVTITAASVGLGLANNTPDLGKPVSDAQAAAIQAAKDRANHTGTQVAGTITDFTAAAQTAMPKVVKQAADGSWPSRLTSGTTDRTVRVTFMGTLPGPTIGTSVDHAVAGVDRLEVTTVIPT